jgi:hypothetical protein
MYQIGSPRPLHFETNTAGNRNNLRPARVLTGKYDRSRLRMPFSWNRMIETARLLILPNGVRTAVYAGKRARSPVSIALFR